MEASGLDFGASGPQFWSFQAPLVERKGFFLTSRGSACFLNRFGRFFRSAHVSLKCMTAPHHSRPKWIPHMQAFNEPQSPKFHASKLGRRRWAPPGGFNGISDPGPTKRKKLAIQAPQNERNWRSGPHKTKKIRNSDSNFSGISYFHRQNKKRFRLSADLTGSYMRGGGVRAGPQNKKVLMNRRQLRTDDQQGPSIIKACGRNFRRCTRTHHMTI